MDPQFTVAAISSNVLSGRRERAWPGASNSTNAAGSSFSSARPDAAMRRFNLPPSKCSATTVGFTP